MFFHNWWFQEGKHDCFLDFAIKLDHHCRTVWLKRSKIIFFLFNNSWRSINQMYLASILSYIKCTKLLRCNHKVIVDTFLQWNYMQINFSQNFRFDTIKIHMTPTYENYFIKFVIQNKNKDSKYQPKAVTTVPVKLRCM